ncbi:DUF1499 domain-containing protein [Devosia sp.]|uniref:DUF1499 domain-containing protein n=1 Tax=Devosia sp. TaxID=1871048 RepID=UPI003263B171
MRILIRTSKWAIWSRRVASIAVPLVVIPVFLHRQRLLTSDVFVDVAAVAGIVATLALLVSMTALARLWQTGDQGWGRAISAFLLSLMCLVPFAYVGAQMLRYPAVTDIATTQRGALPLMLDPGTIHMPPPKLLTAEQLETEFPNIKTRAYPLNLQQTYLIVLHMVEAHGWDITLQRDPTAALDPGEINADVVSLLGWRDEVVLRVTGDAQSAVVDMRSASLNAEHDLGSNGPRIEQFLTQLDDEVTNMLRDNPNANQPADAEPDPAAPDAADPKP